MHGSHRVFFSNPDSNKITLDSNDKSWGMVHILGEGCGCSEIIAEHLIKRKALPNTHEKVYFIGSFPQYEQKLKAAGFSVEEKPEVKKYLEGLPMLIVHNPKGEVKYSGGYAHKIITPITKLLDQEIYTKVKNNTATEKLLIAGCAVSKQIQNQIDPLGLVYK
jgi:translation initiation factor 2 beta subunit (eIF-2beta)/eIF-5